MATKYADRGFLSVNGTTIADLQSVTIRRNQNARAVPSMTPDRFNRGFVEGNIDIDVTATIAVRNSQPRPKLDSIDYAAQDVQITVLVGADQYVVTGVYLKDSDDNAGGVGDEVKTTFNFGGLQVTDGVGNGTLFDTDL